jgi:dihydrofolate reductase
VNDTLERRVAPSAARVTSRPARIALIAAVAQNGVIGAANRLPWHLPEDLRQFRVLTTGHSIIMGRKTWQSIAKALPDRQNIVVTRQRDFAALGAQIAASLEDALAIVTMTEPVFVIGGEALYREALPLAHELHLTEIYRDFAGDAHFPDFARHAWRETHREARRAAAAGGFDFAFTTYERIAGD